MSGFKEVVFRIINRAGDAFIEPRREDGHGSNGESPTHVRDQHQQSLTDAQLRSLPVDVRARNGDDTQYVNPRSENGHGSTPAAPTHITGSVSSSIQQAADAGLCFIAGGRESISPSEIFSLVARNPAESGFIARLFLITGYTSDNESLQVSFIENPDVGASNPRAAVNFRTQDKTTPPVLEISSGVDNLTGGTEMSVAVENTRRERFRFSGPPSLVVDPGQTLAMTILAPGGLTGSRRASANIAWVIEKI